MQTPDVYFFCRLKINNKVGLHFLHLFLEPSWSQTCRFDCYDRTLEFTSSALMNYLPPTRQLLRLPSCGQCLV